MGRPKGAKGKKTLLEKNLKNRTCNTCEEDKLLTEFYSNGKYLMRECKACNNKKRYARELKNKNK